LQQPCGAARHVVHESAVTLPVGHIHWPAKQIGATTWLEPHARTQEKSMPVHGPASRSTAPPSGAPSPQPTPTFTRERGSACTAAQLCGQSATILGFAASSTKNPAPAPVAQLPRPATIGNATA